MIAASIYAAKTRLSALVQAAVAGEEVVITNRNRPVARLVAHEPARRRPAFGAARSAMRQMGLSDADVAAALEGEGG